MPNTYLFRNSSPDLNTVRSIPAAQNVRDRIAFSIFVTLEVAVIVLQKFGITVGEDVIPLGLPVVYAALFILLTTKRILIDPIGLLSVVLFIVSGTLAFAMSDRGSATSMMLVTSLCLPFAFFLNVKTQTFRRCANSFVTMMTLMTPLVLLEWGLQIFVHPGLWLNIDSLFPKSILLQNYMYIRATAFQSPWIEPNGAIFLEVSIFSQFLAIAILFELSYFSRLPYLAALTGGMFLTLGGSGPFLLFLSSPFLIAYTPRRLLIPGLVFLAVLLSALSFTPIAGDFFGRIFEYQNTKSSAHGRYIVPFQVIAEELTSDPQIVIGHGPGTGDAAGAGFSFGKLLYEYGIIGTACYYFAFLRMLTRNGHTFLVNWALFLYFSFLGGGLAVPLYPLGCMVLGGLIRTKSNRLEIEAKQ